MPTVKEVRDRIVQVGVLPTPSARTSGSGVPSAPVFFLYRIPFGPAICPETTSAVLGMHASMLRLSRISPYLLGVLKRAVSRFEPKLSTFSTGSTSAVSRTPLTLPTSAVLPAPIKCESCSCLSSFCSEQNSKRGRFSGPVFFPDPASQHDIQWNPRLSSQEVKS